MPLPNQPLGQAGGQPGQGMNGAINPGNGQILSQPNAMHMDAAQTNAMYANVAQMSGQMMTQSAAVPTYSGAVNPVTGVNMVAAEKVVSDDKGGKSSLIKTIVIVVLSLVSVTFIGLFIWMFVSYNDARTDVDGQISAAVNAAVDEQVMKDEAEFAEREKDPYRTFAGPVDYGELSFEYPKTWSLYVASDASNGGDFKALFNPIEVNASSAINALRLTIRDAAYDTVSAEYQKEMNKKDSGLTVESITFNGIAGDKYTGKIPGTELSGYIVIFKIRDKTAILQTDSVLFEGDFFTLLNTVRFNA